MSRYHEYRWKGERIDDIEAWCKERGDTMMGYKAKRQAVNPYTNTSYEESYTGKIPTFFFFTLAMGNGWTYEAIPLSEVE